MRGSTRRETHRRTRSGSQETVIPPMRPVAINGETHERGNRGYLGSWGPENVLYHKFEVLLKVIKFSVTGKNGMRTVAKLCMYCKKGHCYIVELHSYYVIRNGESDYTVLELRILKCRLQLHFKL